MRDEPIRRRRSGTTVLATAIPVAALLLVVCAPGAFAQGIRGYAQVQYQSQDQRGGVAPDVEWWQRSLHLDYGTKIRDRYDVTIQGEWNDLSYVDRPDRQVNPRGSLRFAHREFGGYASYRPLRVTDALGITTRQRELTLNGYLRRAGLPQVQGTYLRRRQLAIGLTPASTGITRNLTARQELGPLSLHGSWNNQVRFTDLDERQRITQSNWEGGGDWRWAHKQTAANVGLSLQESRLHSATGPSAKTGGRTLSTNASHRFSRFLDAGLTYNYRHTGTGPTADRRNLDDQDGVLLLTARPKRALTFSGGGGLRTARIEDRQDLERYLVATAGLQGPLRPGWTGSASATRSYNWLRGETARPVDAALLESRMRLARGLDANAQAQVTKARASSTIADTSGGRVQFTSQTGVGVTATPLRPITLGYSRSIYRSGESFFQPSATSWSDHWDARWNPVPSWRFSGTLNRARGLNPRERALGTRQVTVQWTPSASLQWDGSYSKNDRSQVNPLTQTLQGREVWGLRLLASVAREWRMQVSVNDVDPGQPTHVRQWDATLTRNVGR